MSELPPAGTVFRYAYLWANEDESGREEATKDRPALVVAVAISQSRVIAVAITHTPPKRREDAVLMPATIKKHLGLDDEPSWIAVTEANIFTWPGPDIRNVPGSDPPTAIYGRIPTKLLQTIARQLLDNDRANRARMVRRTE